MISAQAHQNEDNRLNELDKFEILDSEDEACFDELTELASTICDTPISLISLVDSHRQWFKSRVGLDVTETPKDIAFCSHAILQDEIFEVPNALEDERFADNPLVTGSPDIRFYAGKPLISSDGLPIGTLCVIDKKPNQLNAQQKKALEILAKQVISQLELRLHNRKMQRMNKQREQFYSVLAHDLKSPFNGVIGFSRLLVDHSESFNTDKIKSLSKQILDSSLTIYQILDEILQWTDLYMANGKVILQALDIKACVYSSIALLAESINAKNVNIDVLLSEDVKALGDETLFKTALRNLLSNAIKYSPINGTITVCAETQEREIHLSVRDEGKGIPDTIRQQLFKKAISSTQGTLGEAGHGLGLHLTHELILMQNGRIWLDGTQKGTSISLALPIPNYP